MKPFLVNPPGGAFLIYTTAVVQRSPRWKIRYNVPLVASLLNCATSSAQDYLPGSACSKGWCTHFQDTCMWLMFLFCIWTQFDALEEGFKVNLDVSKTLNELRDLTRLLRKPRPGETRPPRTVWKRSSVHSWYPETIARFLSKGNSIDASGQRNFIFLHRNCE